MRGSRPKTPTSKGTLRNMLTPARPRVAESARLVGDLGSASMNESAMPIAKSEVRMSPVWTIACSHSTFRPRHLTAEEVREQCRPSFWIGEEAGMLRVGVVVSLVVTVLTLVAPARPGHGAKAAAGQPSLKETLVASEKGAFEAVKRKDASTFNGYLV